MAIHQPKQMGQSDLFYCEECGEEFTSAQIGAGEYKTPCDGYLDEEYEEFGGQEGFLGALGEQINKWAQNN